jgi:2-oxoglutarate dehydrogenase E2 component (dihydrolipoamide succinyltransferase)
MAIEIKVPDMGESVIEATVARWMKQEGDPVRAGEPVVELETDKINLEVGAQKDGVLERIVKGPGENVAVGDVLAMVAESGGDGQPVPAAAPETAGEQGDTSGDGQETTGEGVTEGSAPDYGEGKAETPPVDREDDSARVTPVARRMAQEMGIDLARVSPSGSGGRITKEDVQAFSQQDAARPAAEPAQREAAPTAPAPPPAPQAARAEAKPAAPPSGLGAGRPEERIRMTRRRQTIARRLVEAQQTAAMLTTFNEIDMSAVMNLRKRRREAFKERYGVDLGYMPFFIKATIGALKAFPNVNAEIQGEEIVRKQYYDIGIAVGAEEGLVVPVVRDADRLSFAGIETVIRDFVARSRDGALTLDDLRGGTFTITNGGVYGSLLSTPILNPPQVGILGMHRIQERAVVVAGEIVVKPMMYVALSYDHRIVDGREAVQWLVRLKELVEDPESLLMA